MLYVNSERYNAILRRPEPGTETLVSFPNLNELLRKDKLLQDFEISREKIEQISQFFKDVSNTRIVLLQLKYGNILSKIEYLENHNLKENAFGGLISAFNNWSEEVSEMLKPKLKQNEIESPELEMILKNFKVTMTNGEFARLILISDDKVGVIMKKKLRNLIDKYEIKHHNELESCDGDLSRFLDFPEEGKKQLDLALNEECIINTDEIYKYDKNPTLLFMLKEWYEKMKIDECKSSFYPATIPKVLIFKLDIDMKEARYWTYDLFKANMIIPKKNA